jgi:ribosomal protein L30/L7E
VIARPPAQTQANVLADLLMADTADVLSTALLSSLILAPDSAVAAGERAGRRAGRVRYHRFVWDLLQAIRDGLGRAAATTVARERLIGMLRLMHNLFVRGRERKSHIVTDAVLKDLSFLPAALRLLDEHGGPTVPASGDNHLEPLAAAIAEWQTRHRESFADVVAPPGKKQIAQRIDELLGLRKRRAQDVVEDSEAIAQLLNATDGLQQLLHKAERGSAVALRQLVAGVDAAKSFGLARYNIAFTIAL